MAEAARVLGISERAVRKRIQTGTLRASPAGRSYDVWLPALHNPGPEQDRPTSSPGPAPAEPRTGPAGAAQGGGSGPSGPGPEPIEAAFRSASGAVVSDAARLQLAAIRDEWLAPLVERIGALERENGELAGQLAARGGVLAAKDETIAELRRRAEAAEAARLAAERERDELRARLDAAQAAPAATEAPTVLVVEADSHTHPPPLWRRVLRGLRGR